MKKNLFCVWCRGGVLVACALSLLLVSCGGGGGGGSDDYEAPVAESGSTDVAGSGNISEDSSSGSGSTGGSGAGSTAMSVSNGITGSQVFIDGRTVTIWATWCCDHEVTQEEYLSVMGSNPSHFSGTNKPVECVSWYDAITYCNKRSLAENFTPCYTVSGVDFSGNVTVPTSNNETWNEADCNFSANGYRLPTEAEWEYFARGGNTSNSGQTTYSGSNTIGDVAWYCENAVNGLASSNANYGTHQVKTKAKNSLNLYDMSGNVREWCWDWYGSISASTSSSGAPSGSRRVCRGGSWGLGAGNCSVAYRNADLNAGLPHYPNYNGLGFRVVRTAN